jgi:hypothetical protein
MAHGRGRKAFTVLLTPFTSLFFLLSQLKRFLWMDPKKKKKNLEKNLQHSLDDCNLQSQDRTKTKTQTERKSLAKLGIQKFLFFFLFPLVSREPNMGLNDYLSVTWIFRLWVVVFVKE